MSNPNDFPGLESEEKYPKVIVQLDSLGRLSPTTIRRFDIVVIDEMVSVLRHISAPTLKERCIPVLGLLMHHLQKAAKVITMDAFWNEDCYEFLKRLEVSQKLVINDFRPPPRTYKWTKDEALLVQHIKEDLIAGKNVVVTSMATMFCNRLMRQLLDEGILTREEIIMHTAMTDDKLRAKLNDVDAFWVQCRILIYSPTIESGEIAVCLRTGFASIAEGRSQGGSPILALAHSWCIASSHTKDHATSLVAQGVSLI